jgi:ATP-dependent Clp protease ATP-binding subunit ClpA
VCNQAYDLAVTLGAPEVGLEHLVHAMTQIEATAHSLFELNIHVSSLRGETSAIIMEGFSETSRDGKSLPIKSDELEEVLKEAARLA